MSPVNSQVREIAIGSRPQPTRVHPNNSVVFMLEGLTCFSVLGQNRYSSVMNIRQNLLWRTAGAVQAVWQLFRYAFSFFLALMQPQAVLAARILAAESQLAVCKHRIHQKKDPRPRFTAAFRLLWVVLSKCLGSWQSCAHLMQPATVKRWHSTAFRLHWRWKSRRKPGRPPITSRVWLIH